MFLSCRKLEIIRDDVKTDHTTQTIKRRWNEERKQLFEAGKVQTLIIRHKGITATPQRDKELKIKAIK